MFRYLGIEEVPRLADLLLDLSLDWKILEDDLLTQADKLDDTFSEQAAEIAQNIDLITSDPPWGATVTPTFAATRRKIENIANEAMAMGADCSDDTFENLQPGQKLTHILAAVQTVLSGDTQKLQANLDDVTSTLAMAKALFSACQNAAEDITAKTDKYNAVEHELNGILDGATREQITTRLATLADQIRSHEASLEVVRSSLSYILTVETGAVATACPACQGEIDPNEFELRLKKTSEEWDSETKALLDERSDLQSTQMMAARLSEQKRTLLEEIDHNKTVLKDELNKASQELTLSSPTAIVDIEQHIAVLDGQVNNIRSAIETQNEAQNQWSTQVEKLRVELRFHRLRSRHQELQNLYDTRYESLKTEIEELGHLRDVVDSLRQNIKTHLDQRLRDELPPVAKEMTQVYLRLTERPTFDAIIIHHGENEDGTIALDLRVSSSRGAGTWSVEEGILNGQALNAIQLVPYFVFSRYQEGPLLDLLLLDDPTQAFDTRKIELLLKELADAATHATLLVSTHEEDRFLPLLRRYFDQDEFVALRAVELDVNGPRLEDISFAI